jgi:phosphatidylserine/phosphatidylglycerophosphate/cardiolipin synthase-like enzyme
MPGRQRHLLAGVRCIGAAWLAAVVAALGMSAAARAQSPSTPYLSAVAAQLNARAPGTGAAGLWGISYTNTLPAGWLLQTPNCWGQESCANAQQRTFGPLTARMQSLVAGALRSVDISQLYGPPNGQFREAIIKGLNEAIARGNRPLVRFLIGTPPLRKDIWHFFDHQAQEYLDGLESQLRARIPMQVALMKSSPESWDHSKALIVDGRVAMLGGMNYWSQDYLQPTDPVNDVSMLVEGPAARQADEFEDLMWSWTCSHVSGIQNLWLVELATTPGLRCVTQSTKLPAPGSGNVSILTVGRLGKDISVPGHPGQESPPIAPTPLHGDKCLPLQSDYSETNHSRSYEYRNPGEIALRALIMSAHRSVFLSQQDLLSCVGGNLVEPKFDERVFAALSTKVAERVPVTIVLSNPKTSYSNDYSPGEVASTLTDFIAAQQRTSLANARSMVCSDVRLTTIRSIDRPTWPNGSLFRNHAKVVAVDDSAFYIGSENLYPARLQELGFIVESQAASATLRSEYLEPLWRESEPGAIIDPATGRCAFGGQSSTGWEAAFQGANNDLWAIGAQDFPGDLHLGMAAGTSPSIAVFPDGKWEAAFQANTGKLWVVGTQESRGDTQLAMAPGTSPSITGLANGKWQVAFQGANHDLWVTGTLDNRGDTGLGMEPRSSPSITSRLIHAALGSWEAAFQANTGKLWLVGTLDNRGDTGYGMAPATSPSVAAISSGGWQAAFQANTNHLWVIGTKDNRGDTGYGMDTATSPSIAVTPAGAWQAAFQANTHSLWIVGTQDNRGDMQLGMTAGTSPSITEMPSGAWQTAFQANTHTLWVIGTQNDPGETGYAMNPPSGPSIGP